VIYDFLIVTPVLNGEEFIKESIESVRSAFEDTSFKHVFVDGGSQDQTAHIANRLLDDREVWVDAPGSSMYEAINSGLSAAEAEWFYQLNVDDLPTPNAAKDIQRITRINPSVDIITGTCITIDLDKGTARIKVPMENQVSARTIAAKLSVSQPSSFIRTKFLKKIGGYPENFHYAGDTALWLTLLKNGASVESTRRCLGIDRLHGGAARLSARHQTELDQIHSEMKASKLALSWTRMRFGATQVGCTWTGVPDHHWLKFPSGKIGRTLAVLIGRPNREISISTEYLTGNYRLDARIFRTRERSSLHPGAGL
jgi:hypothetical protein